MANITDFAKRMVTNLPVSSVEILVNSIDFDSILRLNDMSDQNRAQTNEDIMDELAGQIHKRGLKCVTAAKLAKIKEKRDKSWNAYVDKSWGEGTHVLKSRKYHRANGLPDACLCATYSIRMFPDYDEWFEKDVELWVVIVESVYEYEYLPEDTTAEDIINSLVN